MEPQCGDKYRVAQTPRYVMVETGPVEPEMDRSLTQPYFLSFWGQPLNAYGQPMPHEYSPLIADKGLALTGSAGPDMFYLFGAT